MKYSKEFERDWHWYLKWKEVFDFDGAFDYTNMDGDNLILEDSEGKSAKEVFYLYDSVKGKKKVIPTSEPRLLFQIFKCKGGINFQIKQWAEDRASGYLGMNEFKEIIKEYELLEWMVKAVENQKIKLYGQ